MGQKARGRAKPMMSAASLAPFGPLKPRRHEGTYVFAAVADQAAAARLEVVATICEPEGVSVVMERSAAAEAGLDSTFEAAWITLEVETALDLVGLTATVATRLAEAGIPCNVVAGARHDHLFVPAERAEEALELLGGDGGAGGAG